MIGISSCLAGVPCRYNGKDCLDRAFSQLVMTEKGKIICPEVLGGLPTPRNPAEIVGGDGFDVWKGTARVLENEGTDVTDVFKRGAKLAYQKLIEEGIDTLVLKSKSPSCGCGVIYSGSFSGQLKKGVGVATAYFLLKGMTVFSDEEWLKKNSN